MRGPLERYEQTNDLLGLARAVFQSNTELTSRLFVGPDTTVSASQRRGPSIGS